MIKQATLSMKSLEEFLKLPIGVHIGSVQHDIRTNSVLMTLLDPDDALPEEATLDPLKGWVKTSSKGYVMGAAERDECYKGNLSECL